MVTVFKGRYRLHLKSILTINIYSFIHFRQIAMASSSDQSTLPESNRSRWCTNWCDCFYACVYDILERAKKEKNGENIHVKPIHPEWGSLKRRLESYANWSVDSFFSKSRFAAAGLFFNPTSNDSDRVTCCYCGMHLGKWCYYDLPIDEHRRWIPSGHLCGFLTFLEVIRDLVDDQGIFSVYLPLPYFAGAGTTKSDMCKMHMCIEAIKLLKLNGMLNVRESDNADPCGQSCRRMSQLQLRK